MWHHITVQNKTIRMFVPLKDFNFKDMKPGLSFSDLPKSCSYPLVIAYPGSAALNLSC